MRTFESDNNIHKRHAFTRDKDSQETSTTDMMHYDDVYLRW
jgi:hypothetical protein